MARKVLVTGGSGRLGRYVVRELAPHAAVTILDRAADPDAAHPCIRADILDLDAVRQALAGQDAVVHLAALDIGTEAPPEDYFRTNTMGTWHVLQAAQESGIARVVVASSIAALGLSEIRPDFPPEYLPVDEDHPMRPVHPYGVSKVAVEEIAKSFVRAGAMSVLCLRPTLVTFPTIMAGAVARAADPDARVMFSYVTPEDAARAFRLALGWPGTGFEVLNVTAADACRDEPILDTAARLFGTLPRLRDGARYRADPHASLLDPARAEAVLGFTARSSWPAVRAAWRAPRGA